jgi:hypothetical protein
MIKSLKSFKQFLLETPLPDDWDSDIYDQAVPFKTRIEYAKKRAEKIGTGSSRVAFVIPYQGRKTVLKIAKNAKGIAQNEAEAEFFRDWYIKDLGITIPMIDYDEKNSKPTWIHTEFAEKAKDSDFRKGTNFTLYNLVHFVIPELTGKTKASLTKGHEDEFLEIDLIDSLVNLLGNYSQIPSRDLERLANWGIYKGNPVIIDLGLSSDVYTRYYSR